MKRGIGDSFQQELKYHRGRLPGGQLDWSTRPKSVKTYPDAPIVKLSKPANAGGPALWDVIQSRRSLRRYVSTPVTENELSQLLWASQGITGQRGAFSFRAAPSAGGLYPVETYLSVHDVEDIDPGIYHYDLVNHQLDQLKVGDYRELTSQAALDQQIARTANVVFIWTGVFLRSKWKYQQRAYRYVYLDAGHIAQNVALAAVALGLGSCQIAALYDDEANALLEVDGEDESVIYMTSIGRQSKQ